MSRIILITTALIFSITISYSQSQREALQSFNQKGKTYLGGEIGALGNFFSFPESYRLNINSSVSIQHNILNRLSVGGGIFSESYFSHSERRRPLVNTFYQNIGVGVSLRYSPFKSNGFFIEGQYKHLFYLNPDIRNFGRIGFSPGYTLMVGKKRNIALDMKLNTSLTNGRFQIHPPTLGVRIPLGRTSKQTN